MKSRRTGWSVLWRTVLAWDLGVAFLAAALLLTVLLTTDRELIGTGAISATAIPFGVAVSGTNIVSLRWFSDRLKGSAFGEIVRSIDPDESVAAMPYVVVAVAGGLTSLLGIFGYVTDGELPRAATVVIFSALLGLGTYSILGTLSLFRMSVHHQRRAARLQAIEEAARRLERGGAS